MLTNVNKHRKHIIGIDLGGTFIKAALFDLQGNLLTKAKLPTQAEDSPKAIVERIAIMARSLLEEADLTVPELLGLGIGVPGNHDFATGTVLHSPNLNWHNVPVKAMLESLLPTRIFLDNDANAAALGELWQGAGQGVRHMVMITVGTGIGGGLILNGSVYRGASGSAGEIGHTILMEGGPRCNCGVKGHLEALTSAPWMVRRLRVALAQGEQSSLADLVDLEAHDIFQAAQAGDPLARQVVADTAKYLGMGLANLVNILNPELIIIGGGVSAAGSLLLDPVREHIQQLALEVPAAKVRVVIAKLGNDAGCYGAAALVLEAK
ncbi:MAG: ROK family protein [Carboxydocellales bacterium]